MKNVTISMDEALLRAVRIEAAKAGKSVSKFIGEMVARKIITSPTDQIDALLQVIDGLEAPGISKDLPKRDDLYSEREHGLLARYEPSRLYDRPGSGREEGHRKTTPQRKKAS